MTSHPKDASEQLFKTMAACQKVCRHLHLPVQSGNDRILSCMNRRYTAAHYLQLVETARRWMPDISLTSDIIVGFPGETEQEFQDTLRLIQTVKFDSLYTFAYSSRPGTKAAEMEGHLDAAVKSDRLQRLMAVQEEIGSSQYAKQVGKWLPVLVESAVAALPGYVSGRAENNMIVDFPGDKSLIGRVIPVKITSAKRLALVGSTGEK